MVEPTPLKPRRPCPICQKPSALAFHPFCSTRCAQVDLSRWMGGQYAIPATDQTSDTDDSPSED